MLTEARVGIIKLCMFERLAKKLLYFCMLRRFRSQAGKWLRLSMVDTPICPMFTLQ